MTRIRSFVYLLLFFSFTPALHAQWETTNGPTGNETSGVAAIDTNIFAGNNNGVFQWVGDSAWTLVGLSGTGVQSLTSMGYTLFAETQGGLSYTNNFGTNWVTYLDSIYIFAFAVSGTNLIAGTDNGIYLSTDNGSVWTVTNADSDDQIYALASLGSNMYAGSVGILISTDNGATWNQSNNALTGIDVYALTVSGNDLFAGTEGYGIYISTDNGASWNPSNTGLTDSNVYALTAVGSKLFAGTQDTGVFLSLDNGATWLDVNDSFPYDAGVFAFTTDGTYLYAATGAGVWQRALSNMNGADAVQLLVTAEPSFSVYPNPFTQSTTISFTTPESGVARITIVNILGAEVAQVFSGELSSGDHSFTWNASVLPQGMYECLIQMNGQVQQIPVILSR